MKAIISVAIFAVPIFAQAEAVDARCFLRRTTPTVFI
jgi:hypothetical protein